MPTIDFFLELRKRQSQELVQAAATQHAIASEYPLAALATNAACLSEIEVSPCQACMQLCFQLL